MRQAKPLPGRSAVPAFVTSAAPFLRAGCVGHALLLLALLLLRAGLLLLGARLGLLCLLELHALLLRLTLLHLGLSLRLLLRLLLGLHSGLHLFLRTGLLLLLLLLQLLLAGLHLRLFAGLVPGLHLHLCLALGLLLLPLLLLLLLLLPRLLLATQAGGLHLHLLLLLLAHARGIGHGTVAVLPVLPVLLPHALLRGGRRPRRHAGIAAPLARHGGSGQGGWRALHPCSLGRMRSLRPLAELARLRGRHRVHPGLQRCLRPVIGPQARAAAIGAVMPGRSLRGAGRQHALGRRRRAALRWPQAQPLRHAAM
uniref:hypothetical protein n=1 Tax=Delftia lacustris TaxID=558537 RepID=UPI0012E299EE